MIKTLPRTLLKLLILPIVCVGPVSAFAQAPTPSVTTQEAQSFAEYEAVTLALQPYIKAAKSGDSELVRSAFYDHAHIVGSTNGTFHIADADSFAKNFSKDRPSPDIQHRIVRIDISGPAAAAKVEFMNWSGFRFTDFFILYKKDGQWKISGKVYDSHSKN